MLRSDIIEYNAHEFFIKIIIPSARRWYGSLDLELLRLITVIVRFIYTSAMEYRISERELWMDVQTRPALGQRSTCDDH